MARVKRSEAAISGANIARTAAVTAGREIRLARKRRRLTQTALGLRVGLSRARMAEIEAGQGGGAPLEAWFSIAQALGRYLRFEFARDSQQELADAGHLQMQELVLRVARTAGWEAELEALSRAWGSARSIDCRLLDRKGRRLVIGECWNTFGDLGAATRSSNAKVGAAHDQAAAIGGNGAPFQVGLVWIVRDTAANRALLNRYAGIFESRFPGPSAQWVRALSDGGPVPKQPGLAWCDVGATRLFAHRRGRRAPRPPSALQ